jgi:hypothetical protein
MKPRYFCVMTSFVLFSIPATTFADNFVGIGLGGNFSSFSTENPGANNSTEFTANIFADWALGGIWYLQTGLRYTSYGISGSDYGFSVSETAHYLEIPVLIKPTFDAGGWFPYLLAGPSLGLKLGEGVSGSEEGQAVNVGPDFFNTINFMADFGAGAEIPVASGFRAYVQFDYALGFVFNAEDLGGSHTRGANVTAGAMMAF